MQRLARLAFACMLAVGPFGCAHTTAPTTQAPQASSQTPPPSSAFFYDAASGEIFVAAAQSNAPVRAPSGGEGVRAIVFSCGACDDLHQKFVGWLEKVDSDGEPMVGEFAEHVVWHNAASPEEARIKTAAMQRCNGDDAPQRCHPPS